jgi:SAM-dependent methyltransferase
MPADAEGLPDPGEELISRVSGRRDREWFFSTGRESVRDLQHTLAIAGRTLDSFESILDFGCGCGRMLLWMKELGSASALHGTDIDSEAIAWCQEHIPYARATVNHETPPLPYTDAAFDLVYAHSVFTHIDERRQDLWLSELQRVARPGALIVLSVHGEIALPTQAWDIRDRLERDGIAFMDHTAPRDLSLPDWYQNTWHAPWYVFEHWGRWFEIRAYVPGAGLGVHDHVLLERRSDEAPPRRPLVARPPLPAAGAPESRVADALATTRAYRQQTVAGQPLTTKIRALARRAALRAIRPYSAHEDKFDDAVATSIAELSRAADHHAAALKDLEHRLDEQG